MYGPLESALLVGRRGELNNPKRHAALNKKKQLKQAGRQTNLPHLANGKVYFLPPCKLVKPEEV